MPPNCDERSQFWLRLHCDVKKSAEVKLVQKDFPVQAKLVFRWLP